MAMTALRRNFPFVREQFTVALGNSSVVVKFVCFAVLVCYFLTFSEGAFRALVVTPGNVLPPNFWVWTYFTHSFVEVHIWIVFVDIAVVVLCGKLLEPLWGAFEMLVFYLVVNMSVAVCSTFTYLIIYLVSRNPDYLFETFVHGLAGYVAGFAVAVKQVMPDHVLVNSPFGKLRNKHIPTIMLVLATIVRIIGGVDGPYPIMFGWGLVISWLYLRFYQKHSNGNRGDMADSFSFASFFPDSLKPLVSLVCNMMFSCLVKMRICKRPQRRYDVSAPTTITVSLPGMDPQDAERRRQLALKALNERLSKVSDTNTWPSLEDNEATPPITPESSSGGNTDVEMRPRDAGAPSTGSTAATGGATGAVAAKPPAEKPASHSRSGSASMPRLPVPDFKENAKLSEDGASGS